MPTRRSLVLAARACAASKTKSVTPSKRVTQKSTAVTRSASTTRTKPVSASKTKTTRTPASCDRTPARSKSTSAALGKPSQRKGRAVSLSDAANMVFSSDDENFDDGTEKDDTFEFHGSSSEEDDATDSGDEEVEEEAKSMDDSSPSPCSSKFRRKLPSSRATTPAKTTRSRGEPSSRGAGQTADATPRQSNHARGKTTPAPQLAKSKTSAKKQTTPAPQLAKSKTSAKKQTKCVKSPDLMSRGKYWDSSDKDATKNLKAASDFMERSLQSTVKSCLPGLEIYAEYNTSTNANVLMQPSTACSSALKCACDAFPERKVLIEKLATLIGSNDAVLPPCLYLVGHTACGKTSVVRSTLQALDVFTVWVDGMECYAQDVLFTLILSRLSGGCTSSRSETNDSFVRRLDELLADGKHKRMVLVVDNVHRFLRFSSPGPIPLLQRLHSLVTTCSVGVVLISSLPWEDLWPCTYSTVPLQIRFPNYTQDELVAILTRDCPAADQLQAYNTFVQLFCSCSKLSCTNLRQLRHLIHILYPVYYQPVLSGEVSAKDKHELWRRLVPIQRRIVNNFFQHSARTETVSEDGARRQSSTLDLPYYAKYLVIAGFLASHNPATMDTHLFTKAGDRLSKRQRHAAKKPGKDIDYKREGPKVFPMHRLMAIFFSVVEQSIPPSAHIFSQVRSLVSLKLFSQESDASRAVDDPHYMCLASEDVVLELARSVDFDLAAVQNTA